MTVRNKNHKKDVYQELALLWVEGFPFLREHKVFIEVNLAVDQRSIHSKFSQIGFN